MTGRPTVAFVGSTPYPDLTDDDRLLVEPLKAAGIDHRVERWDDPAVDWPSFDAVVLRTPWDYWERPEAFAAWIDAMAAGGTNVWNPPAVLRWNADKRYLQEIAVAGVPVVETEWLPRRSDVDVVARMRERGWDRAVLKPVVSAGGWRTWRLDAKEPVPADAAALLREADAMLQPFLPEVVRDGELSLVYLEGRFSHAARKRTAGDEFRVQERFGGTVEAADATPDLIAQGERVLAAAPGELLYARVDGVVRDGELILIELEVLEPSLFFGFGPGSAARFVDAIAARLR